MVLIRKILRSRNLINTQKQTFISNFSTNNYFKKLNVPIISNINNDDKPSFKDICTTGLLSFSGIGMLSYFHNNITDCSDYSILLGSFGASAVLLYGYPNAPFSQPRNVIGGHILAAITGITSYKLMSMGLYDYWLIAPISVSVSSMLMKKTNTAHPPAGGTALIAALGSEQIINMGYYFLIPTTTGAFSLVFTSWIMNNIFFDRKYPKKSWL